MKIMLTVEICGEDVLHRRNRNFGQGRHAMDSGIIHQHIDAAEFLQRSIDCAMDAVLAENVQFQEKEPRIAFETRHGVPRSRGRHDEAISLRKLSSEGEPYTAEGASSDHHNWTVAELGSHPGALSLRLLFSERAKSVSFLCSRILHSLGRTGERRRPTSLKERAETRGHLWSLHHFKTITLGSEDTNKQVHVTCV